MLVERTSALVETLMVWSHEVLRRGAPGGAKPFTPEKVASSKQVKKVQCADSGFVQVEQTFVSAEPR